MQDYRVKITIRNERLLAAIEGMGFESVAKFCAEHILNYDQTSEIIRGKLKPINENGKLNNKVENLLNILELDIKDAFTPKQLQGFKNTSYEVKVKEKELMQLVNPVKNQELKYIETEVKKKISEVLAIRLTPREEKVVRMRFGIGTGTEHTLTEIGQQFGITNSRTGQILARAIRKLKHPSVACHLINTGFYDTFTKVAIKPKQIKQAEDYLIEGKIEKERKKEIERNLMKKKKVYLKNFIREISNHRINYKSNLWTYSLCKQGLREGFFPRFYYRTTRNYWNWLSNNLRSIMQEKIQDDKIVKSIKSIKESRKKRCSRFLF